MNWILIAAGALAATLALPASAAPCGNSAAGYDTWKAQMAAEAKLVGVGAKGLAALAGTSYASKTIAADRGQKSFRLSFAEFWKKRGGDTIVAQGRKRKAKNPAFYASLEQRFGVPAGVIIAIHGMETGFGSFMGNANVLSAISTLAYDCRRSEFFTNHMLAALVLVDKGVLSPGTVGARNGEVGHTHFLPGNVRKYAVDGDGDGRISLDGSLADALASTANYLRAKGWQPGVGYQEGQPNFQVIKQWNAATVYQQAIAVMGARIDR